MQPQANHAAPRTAQPSARPSPKRTDDTDRSVGARIATIRKLRGLSQSELGDAIGVSFQQVQKYEKGQNRVGAGRLAAVAGMLGVAITELYGEVEGLPDDATLAERLSFDGAVDLLALYAAIPAAEQRRSLLNVARALAGAPVGAA